MDFSATRDTSYPKASIRRPSSNRDPSHNGPQMREMHVGDAYERCHPGDTFYDLKARAHFSKEDRGLLKDWMAAIANGGH